MAEKPSLRTGINLEPPAPAPAELLLDHEKVLHNLPAPITRFVGRREELGNLQNLLHQERLVTVVGPGGSGKTRLAVQAGWQAMPGYADGVWLVPLMGVTSPDLFLYAVSEALQLPSSNMEPQKLLANALRSKQLLLILDNFEQLAPVAGLLTGLLQAAPQVTALITSRQRLNLYGECVFSLTGLDLPAQADPESIAASGAGQLFIQNARRARPDFTLTLENSPAVQRICQLVEGMPLALELAGTWARGMDCGQIAAQIEHDLDFLAAGWQDQPRHRRSMRALLEHSWGMLLPGEQRTLRRLSVFAGRFDVAAAREVAEVSQTELVALVDKSLLAWDGESAHYESHPLLRRFANERLEENPKEGFETRQRHSRHFLEMVEKHRAALRGPKMKPALHELSEAFNDIRQAWDWALENGETPQLDGALEGLFLFYHCRSRFQEGGELFTRSAGELTQLSTAAAGRLAARLLNRAAVFLNGQGRYPESKVLLEEHRTAILNLAEPAETVLYWHTLGVVMTRSGKLDEGLQMMEDALSLARSANLPGLEMDVLTSLGYHHWLQSAFSKAEDIHENALAISRRLQDVRAEGYILFLLGVIKENRGMLAEAMTANEFSLKIARELGDIQRENQALNQQAALCDRQGLIEEALEHFTGVLKNARLLGNLRLEAMSLNNRGTVLQRLGDYAAARKDYDQALQLFTEINFRRGVSMALCNLSDFNNTIGDLAAAQTYGERLLHLVEQDQDRLGGMYAHMKLGMTFLLQGQPDRSKEHYQQGLDLAMTLEQPDMALEGYIGLAAARLAAGDPARAAAGLEPVFKPPVERTLDKVRDLTLLLKMAQVLLAGKDARAGVILEKARSQLLASAAHIQDERLHRLYLENVTAHREILALSAELAKTSAPAKAPAALADPLTRQEVEILRLLAAGLTNQQIAEKLVISVGTVKFHVHNLYGKLNAQSRTQAVACGRELGLIQD
ncbi:MAG TPA: tetratricopeptide repeat protein [Anaerolineaceae bacterium]|nr:tetratricopeptide repeat protein [Anaerolineaceae bacterium]HPN53428.1 tetratricopeptide repeat protein [Anaerolineaceae bacterium]